MNKYFLIFLGMLFSFATYDLLKLRAIEVKNYYEHHHSEYKKFQDNIYSTVEKCEIYAPLLGPSGEQYKKCLKDGRIDYSTNSLKYHQEKVSSFKGVIGKGIASII